MFSHFKKTSFILTLLFSNIIFAGDITYLTGFENSLSKLTSFQSSMSFRQHDCPIKPTPICPSIIEDLVKDDMTDRALIIESRAPICKSMIAEARKKKFTLYNNAVNAQKFYENGRFGYLGDYSHSVIKSCIKSNTSSEVDQISKFYYYNARLNQGATKITQERFLIAKLLKTSTPPCPNNDMLAAASKVCEVSKSCASEIDIKQFSSKVEKDEELYSAIVDQLKAFPQNCEQNEKCKSERSSLSASLMGLIKLNPWFLNESFKSEKRKFTTEQRLKSYLTLTDRNLSRLEKKISETSDCIHGKVSEKCGLDDMREVLSYTPEMPEVYVKNRVENQLSSLMQVQSCLEDGSLDRNRVGQIMNDTYVNVGLTVATLGLGALANSARLASSISYGRATRVLAESLNLSFDIYSAAISAKETIDACNANKLSFQFQGLNEKEVCESSGSSLSPANRKEGSCLVSTGFTAFGALVAMPGGARVFKLMKEAGYIKPQNIDVAAQPTRDAVEVLPLTLAATASTSTRATTTATHTPAVGTRPQARKEDLAISSNERRAPGASSSSGARVATQIEGKIGEPISIATVPNLPTSIRISEFEKADGTKSIFYSFPELLPNGTWVKSSRELPIDSISGGINANFPAGRELFEKIAHEKSGKAYLAFIDVGSLGAVNKTFKAGDAAGDRYLKAVADKIMKNGEGKITLARLGGDEFGLIIDETDPKKVKALLEKIQTDIRLDLAGDAKQVFRDEKIVRAEEYKEAIARILKEKGSVTEADKAAVRARIDELARIQQPDISIGSTQIGRSDNLPSMLERAEAQAKKMKTQTALEFGRSAEKYGSTAVPRATPSPMYRAPVEAPATSSTWSGAAPSTPTPPAFDAIRDMLAQRKEEIQRIGSTSVARYEDEAGRSSYRAERFVTDPVSGQRRTVSTEIPTRGNT
ncbi:MAG: diguanylate cyclase, partial [Pseudobdellovibrio sp.]